MDLKNTFEALVHVAKQCFNTSVSLGKVVLRLGHIASLPKAAEPSCIVLGNGPSLSQSFSDHPDFFKKHPLVCVNSFSLSEKYAELKPSYYVMLDPGFWLNDGELVRSTMESIKSKTSWPLGLFAPVQAKRSVFLKMLQDENPNIRVTFFNYTVFKGFKALSHIFYKRNMAMPQCQNVVAASLFLSVNMGFRNVYLFGADHTWHQHLHVDEDNTVCVKQIHFYENTEKINYVPFYKGLHLKEVFRMDELFMIFGKTFYSYMAINEYALSRSCTIYNASAISYIDAFKRIRL